MKLCTWKQEAWHDNGSPLLYTRKLLPSSTCHLNRWAMILPQSRWRCSLPDTHGPAIKFIRGSRVPPHALTSKKLRSWSRWRHRSWTCVTQLKPSQDGGRRRLLPLHLRPTGYMTHHSWSCDVPMPSCDLLPHVTFRLQMCAMPSYKTRHSDKLSVHAPA